MFYYAPDGIWAVFGVIIMFLIYKSIKQDEKKAFQKAKAQFLAMPETQLYLKKGYEISKITYLGGSEYEFSLTLNPNKDPRNKKTKETSKIQVKSSNIQANIAH